MGIIESGEFTDARDGRKYRTVKIGNQVWMAENLNFEIDGSWCYDNDEANAGKYGRLYTWDAAMAACPAGWRLPPGEEWARLCLAVGGKRDYGFDVVEIWEGVAKKLKSKSGWSDKWGASGSGNGTDKYNFSALPGGGRIPDGDFCTAGDYGHWWTPDEDGSEYAHYRYIHCFCGYLGEAACGKANALSVRCVAIL